MDGIPPGVRQICLSPRNILLPTLKRAEAGGPIKVADETIAGIAKALEKAGVEFIAENGGGAGVRLAKKGKRGK
jgi:hypothetical protein